jgi:hypothetical protein
MNVFAVIESWQRRHSLCQLASLCEHWELHNKSFVTTQFSHVCDVTMDLKMEQREKIKFCVKHR